jgi:hypothetical protein
MAFLRERDGGESAEAAIGPSDKDILTHELSSLGGFSGGLYRKKSSREKCKFVPNSCDGLGSGAPS